jgi:hypothetical protein
MEHTRLPQAPINVHGSATKLKSGWGLLELYENARSIRMVTQYCDRLATFEDAEDTINMWLAPPGRTHPHNSVSAFGAPNIRTIDQLRWVITA